MHGTPADVPFVWVAVLVVSASVLGVVLAMPSAPPPDADRVAAAIDDVAATDHPAATTVPLDAEELRLEPATVAIRDSGGTAHASLHYGPIVPVERDSELAAVVRGVPPETVYASPSAFAADLERARSRNHTWQSAGDEVVVRRVNYEGVEGVLVGQ